MLWASIRNKGKNMNKFDYSNIVNLNLNFNNAAWNSTTHNVTVSHDPNSPGKFLIKMTPVYDEPVVGDLTLANNVLNKFRKAE